ncbi:MAG: CofH family radical SAM protein, partial [Opitutales bacterium]|nr:CofH family radical SAM protein [Opitutales bacterium]
DRIDADSAARLLGGNPIDLGERADAVRRRLHANRAFYTVNAAITYSNTCEALCPICSFARREGQQGAYVLSPDEVHNRALNFSKMGAREIHIIGGIYSKLPLQYYIDIIKAARAADKNFNIVAFTVSECSLMAKISGKKLSEICEILQGAGVNALPGGGAEIFNPQIRRRITPNKLTGEEWLEAMRIAHLSGLKTNATMLYGHIETPRDAADHLLKLRDLQDKTGGFKAFVPLPFRKGKSDIPSNSSATYDIKICALARLVLDNFAHIRVPITHFDERLAQVLLCFGADDIGGTHWHEEVAVSAGAGANDRSAKKLESIIKTAGFEPVLTNSNYDA